MYKLKCLEVIVILIAINWKHVLALEPTIDTTAQRLSDQVRVIQRLKRLDDATLDRLRLEALTVRAAITSTRDPPATSPDPMPALDLASGAPRVDPSVDEEEIANHSSLQIIPERATVKYINEKYIYENATIYVRRYGRKSGYYINIEGATKVTFGNNVSLTLIFFEYLHNEYKRSFVEMKFEKICDSVNKDPYVGKAFKMIGMPCPLPPAVHKLMNITVPGQDFPNVWPFERCKVEATLHQNENKDVLASADVYVSFKQKPRNT